MEELAATNGFATTVTARNGTCDSATHRDQKKIENSALVTRKTLLLDRSESGEIRPQKVFSSFFRDFRKNLHISLSSSPKIAPFCHFRHIFSPNLIPGHPNSTSEVC